MKTRYPIYIISKGRWENPKTANFLMKEDIPFYIAVEPQEYDNYCKTIPKEFILKLPFQDLGLGSFPARNHCWEHSIEMGYRKHFLFDDNISGFRQLIRGKRVKCKALPALHSLENFSDRYSNLAMSGYNYSCFAVRDISKPFFLNCHVYSGMLIRNDIPYRWRMKYNEDVDLNLQALHDKWCTVALNVYLIDKTSTTAKQKGGNQTELYLGNARDKKILKTKSLEMVWPQYVKSTIRFGRPHHSVSWGKFFKHPLKRIS